MEGATVDRTTFYYTNFERTKLKSIKGKKAKFNSCNMRGALLSFTNLEQADFKGSGMVETNFFRARCYRCKFEGVYMNETNFKFARLQRSNFKNAWLYGADLKYANLQRANFENAWLFNTDLRGADFRNTNLRKIKRRGLENAKFNDRTKLPFSKEYALSLGMIYTP